MKKLLQKSAVLAALLLYGHAAHAYDFTQRNDNDTPLAYNITSPTTVEVTKNTSAASDLFTYVLIPDEVTEDGVTYQVTSIAEDAFRNNGNVTAVYLGRNVAEIQGDAFGGCSRMQNLIVDSNNSHFCNGEFGERINYVAYNADKTQIVFFSKTNTIFSKTAIFPASVTSIGDYAFSSCRLTEFEIPEAINAIGTKAFNNCNQLASITVNAYNPASIALGDDVFYGVNKQTCTLHVPYGSLARYRAADQWKDFFNIEEAALVPTTEGLVYTRNGNAYYVSGYTSDLPSVVVIPSEYQGLPVTRIEGNAFKDCSALTSIFIPNTITIIWDKAFNGCSSLKEVILEDGETDLYLGRNYYTYYGIGKDLFYDCPIETLYLGRYVYTSTDSNSSYNAGDGYYPFYNIKSTIKNLAIGDSFTKFNSACISGLTELEYLELKSLETWCNISFSSATDNPMYYVHDFYLNGVKVENLAIPNSVSGIKSYAFYGCTGLTSVEIPNSVTSIGSSAFYGCTGLASAIIGNSVTTIGSSAFYGCTGLTSIEIPNSVTTIGSSAFYGCTGLASATIGNSVTTIDNSAFYGCTGLTTIEIPNSVTSIGDCAFYGCTSLASATIGNSVTSIGSSAFFGCTGLTSIEIPESVTSIGSAAFYGCTGLTSIEIPESVTSIGSAAFYGCTGLTSIEIPNAVTTIGLNAFYNCTALTSAIIGSSVTSIGDWAFNGCTALKNIVFRDGDSESTLTLGHNLQVASGDPGKGMFYDCPIETLYIGRNLNYNRDRQYGYSPFYSNTNIQTVIFGETVKTIPNSIFSNCSALTSAIIGSSVTSIGSSAFNGCSGLTSIIIPNSATSIGDSAFSNCSELTSVIIGESVTAIEYSAFYNCSKLTSIEIPDSVTRIGQRAFENCSGLTSIIIGKSVSSIGQATFRGCSSLKDIVFKDGTGTLILEPRDYGSVEGHGTFNDCPLESVYLGRNLSYNTTKAYGYSPFYNQSKLESLTIGELVTTIPAYAFAGCSGIDRVEVKGTINTISSDSFAGGPIFVFRSQTPGEQYGYASNLLIVPHAALQTYKAAWPDHASEIISDGLPTSLTLNVEANVNKSDIVNKIDIIADEFGITEKDLLLNVMDLKLIGSINSYDVMTLHNKMLNLVSIDLSEVNIVANSYEYYSGYCTKDNIVTSRFLYNMGKLRSAKLPNSATNIESWAVGGGSPYVTDIVIGSNTQTIGSFAFKGITSLKSVDTGDGVLTIYEQAFQNCTGLQSVRFGNSVSNIKSNAFDGCTSLKSVVCGPNTKTIESNAFKGCTALESVELGESMTSLYPYAFSGCSNLTSVTVADSAPMAIGYSAFQNCTSLEEISTGNSTVSIGDYAFKGCTKLRSATIGNGTTSIGKEAFKGLTALRSVTMGTGMQTINTSAFEGCTGLSTLVLGRNVETIENNAFKGCRLLESFVIPEGVVSINDYAFQNCTGLKHVSFSPGLKTIKQYAFSGCSSLEDAMLPTTLETIEQYAFSSCTSLAEVKIPASIKSIANNSFNVNSVRKVYVWTIQPTQINEQTFSTMSYQNGTLYVPATAKSLYFYGNSGWSRFIDIQEFDAPYEYFYLNGEDLWIDEDTPRLKGGEGEQFIAGMNPDADLDNASGLLVEGEESQNLGEVNLESSGSNSATLIGGNSSQAGNNGSNINIDNLNIRIAITKNKWYFFCFPFDIEPDMVHFDGQYVWRWYDGAERALNGRGGWKNTTGTLQAGHGYIFQGSVDGTLVLNVGRAHINAAAKHIELAQHVADNLAHSSWNFVGNPYTSYYDIADLGYNAPVTIWNGTTYEAYHPDDDRKMLYPYQAFFVQKPAATDGVDFDPAFRLTKKQSLDQTYQENIHNRHQSRMRRANANKERYIVNVELTDGSDLSDRTRVVFNDQRSNDYEIECDAAKFLSTTAPQIYSIGADNTFYSINERPMGDSVVRLGFYAPADGIYTFSTSRQDCEMEIVDLANGKVTPLSEGYTFAADKGTDNDRFVLRRAPETTTAIGDNLNEAANGDNSVNYNLMGVPVGNDYHGVVIEKNNDGARKVFKK